MSRRLPTNLGEYISIVCPQGASTAVASLKISANTGVHQGQVTGIKTKVSKCKANATFTIRIKDGDGDVIYSITSASLFTSSASTASTHVLTGLDIPIVEQERIIIKPSADPSTGGMTVRVSMWYKPSRTGIHSY